jgi:stringent starvation protein B
VSEQSAKPYLVRAICEWCADSGLTPYLAVKVNERTRVPAAFVKNGEIVLNVSASATRRLTIDNDAVRFSARFSGASQEVSVPMDAVAGIFAKETGYGFAFAVAQGPVAALTAATEALQADVDAALERDAAEARAAKVEGKHKPKPKPRARASHLQVIK